MGLTKQDIQLLILRVALGIDFIHHFAEKFGLLGKDAYQGVYGYFASLHYTNPGLMVLIAGLCEFGAFIGFTFGLFTRIAAVGTALYLLIAAVEGHHFTSGFTWANAGGGWEFPVLWAIFCLSFVLTGGGKISLDAWLKKRFPHLCSCPFKKS